MNKILRYSLVCLLAMMSTAIFAKDDVVIDFNSMDIPTSWSANEEQGIEASEEGDITSDWTKTIDGVTITISPKEEGNRNANRFWKTNNGPQLRCYSGTITISASETMKSIKFAVNNSKFALSADNGTIANNTWTGESSEVVFTVTGNTQLNSITVSFGEGGGGGQEQTEISVAKALEIIEGLADGAKTEGTYQVKGFVVGDPDFQRKDDGSLFGNVVFDMADAKGGSPVLTVFRCKSFNGASFDEETINILKADDEVVVEGLLQKFKDKNTGEITPEIAQNGKIISINGMDASSVNALTVDKNSNAPVYNMAGQRVSKAVKGVYIQNGKKFVVK